MPTFCLTFHNVLASSSKWSGRGRRGDSYAIFAAFWSYTQNLVKCNPSQSELQFHDIFWPVSCHPGPAFFNICHMPTSENKKLSTWLIFLFFLNSYHMDRLKVYFHSLYFHDFSVSKFSLYARTIIIRRSLL